MHYKVLDIVLDHSLKVINALSIFRFLLLKSRSFHLIEDNVRNAG